MNRNDLCAQLRSVIKVQGGDMGELLAGKPTPAVTRHAGNSVDPLVNAVDHPLTRKPYRETLQTKSNMLLWAKISESAEEWLRKIESRIDDGLRYIDGEWQ